MTSERQLSISLVGVKVHFKSIILQTCKIRFISFSRTDKAGHPQWFVLGVGQVIRGLDIGMLDMCPGEKRKVTVPSVLAFGEKGKGR